jgi:hypothetical protein
MGYGTEALSTFIKFIYSLPCVPDYVKRVNYPINPKDNYTDFNRNNEEPPLLLDITTFEDNKSSQKLAQKLGFKYNKSEFLLWTTTDN